MSGLRLRKRQTGATVLLEKRGAAIVRSATGAEMTLSNAASTPGFNPVDLLYAALCSCLALSARVAASELGCFDRFDHVRVSVSGDKSDDEFARVAAIRVSLVIAGDLDLSEKRRIAERAERICTISNTLRDPPAIELALT